MWNHTSSAPYRHTLGSLCMIDQERILKYLSDWCLQKLPSCTNKRFPVSRLIKGLIERRDSGNTHNLHGVVFARYPSGQRLNQKTTLMWLGRPHGWDWKDFVLFAFTSAAICYSLSDFINGKLRQTRLKGEFPVFARVKCSPGFMTGLEGQSGAYCNKIKLIKIHSLSIRIWNLHFYKKRLYNCQVLGFLYICWF